MTYKTLVILALLASISLAQDSFLIDKQEVGRKLAAYTASQVTTTCTADSACSTGQNLTSCCARWTRNGTSIGSYCTPLVITGDWFVYSNSNFTIVGCTSATNTLAALGKNCTTNDNCTSDQACTMYSWANGTSSSSWTSSGALGSYCQKINGTSLAQSEVNSFNVSWRQVGSTSPVVSGSIMVYSQSMTTTSSSSQNFGAYIKTGAALVMATLAVFLY